MRYEFKCNTCDNVSITECEMGRAPENITCSCGANMIRVYYAPQVIDKFMPDSMRYRYNKIRELWKTNPKFKKEASKRGTY